MARSLLELAGRFEQAAHAVKSARQPRLQLNGAPERRGRIRQSLLASQHLPTTGVRLRKIRFEPDRQAVFAERVAIGLRRAVGLPQIEVNKRISRLSAQCLPEEGGGLWEVILSKRHNAQDVEGGWIIRP